MVQVKVRPALASTARGPADPLMCTQDVRDFVLHLLANDKAQSWLYVQVRPPSLPLPARADRS